MSDLRGSGGDTGGSGGDRPPSESGASAETQDSVRMREDALEGTPESRDSTPALGTRGQPASWKRAVEGARVAISRPNWGDARWSNLYGTDTGYAVRGAVLNGQIPAAARAMRGGEELPEVTQGPIIQPAIWTWEVPLYFWVGGIATGSSFVALACDLAGDHRSAATARKVTLAAIGPGSPLLIMDLGKPLRFLNMLRIFKVRSPMSMGAWCLVVFSNLAAGSVAADLFGRPKLARALGGGSALFGTYLGSYTGVLLASTAVPVWNRSRLFLPPIFVATALATGAALNRLVLAGTGTRVGHPTRRALGALETGAMALELGLSSVNEKRLGRLSHALEEGGPGKLFQGAKWGVRAGLALRLAGRLGPTTQHASSLLFLAAGLAFRYAWVGAGRTSARDDEAVARTARVKARPLGSERV